MSEGALLDVNRKLMDAEQRVHAGIGQEPRAIVEQRLPLVATELVQLFRELSNPADEVLNSLDRIREKTSPRAADAQALASALRPYKPEYLESAAYAC